MRDWKNIILPEYEIRKSRKQKTAFIEMLSGIYGDRISVEEEKGGLKSRNIIIGDPETAKVVFTAHYDTCARMPFPNFITPCNFSMYLVYQLLITAVLLALPFGLAALAARLSADLPELTGLLLTELALFVPLILETWLLMAGPANPHTANDNTSGVVTVLTICDRLTESGRSDAAFILFDHEEMGLLGSSAYAKRHPDVKKNTMIVNLDCVSDGDNILFVYSKQARDSAFAGYISENADEILGRYSKTLCLNKKAFYPSDQAAFKNSAAAAALKKARFVGLYMDKIHTPKDTEYDDRNIEALAELLCGYMEKAQDNAPKTR